MTDSEQLRLFYWPGACSLAAHVALEETGLPFDAVRVDFASGAQRTPKYLAINPKGRVPALANSEEVLTENPAILRHLAAAFAQGTGVPVPSGMAAARELEWMCWLSSTVHVAYAHISRTERYAYTPEGVAEVKRKGEESCRPLWEKIEAALSGRDWALGDQYSLVDPYLQVFWNWGRGDRLRYNMSRDFPNWTAHARRLLQRPAAKRAFEREGLKEP